MNIRLDPYWAVKNENISVDLMNTWMYCILIFLYLNGSSIKNKKKPLKILTSY